MHIPTTFQCPKCGAPIPFHYGDVSAECAYCGNTVFVPADLRPPPPTQSFPPPYPPVQVTPPHIPPTMVLGPPTITVVGAEITEVAPAAQRRRRTGVPAFVLVLLLLGAAAAVLAFVASRSPYFFDNLFAGGFARLDQTYGDASTADALTDLVSVAVDNTGTVSAVTSKGQVSRFAADGTALPGWSIESGDNTVWSIKADSGGSLYIVANGILHKEDASAGYETKSIKLDDIFGMYDVAFAPDGSLVSYLGAGTDQLVRLSPDGSLVDTYNNALAETVGEGGIAPWEIRLAVDSTGLIYLLNEDSSHPPIFVFTADGKYKSKISSVGSKDGQLSFPQAIAIDSKDRIYVAAGGGIKVFDTSGTYIGIVRLPFSNTVSGITFDNSDHLYVVSRSETKIYRFTLNEP